MSHRTIRSLFEVRLSAWATSKGLRIGYQNASFKPKVGETALLAFTIPAGVASNDLAGAHRMYTGTFQVTILVPNGSGPGGAEALAEELAEVFKLNDRLTRDGLTVLVMTPPEPGPGQNEDTHYAVPVSFIYRADSSV